MHEQISDAPDTYGSNLVSLPAIALFLVLAVLAANAGMTALSVFLFGVFLVALSAFLWSACALRRVSMRLEGKSAYVFQGQVLRFKVVVRNGKILPLLWLGFSFCDRDIESFPPVSGRFSWILPWQEAAKEFSWEASRRGILHLREAALFSGDGFGLAVRKRIVSPSGLLLLVVYPKVTPVDLTRFPLRSAELEKGMRGYQEDITLLKSSRAYAPGDAAKRINWRLLAGSGQLDVNVYETVLPAQVTLLLDLDAFSDYEVTENEDGRQTKLLSFFEEQMEEMLSLAASLLTAFAGRKEKIALFLPRTETQPGGSFSDADPDAAVPAVLTALAGIRYKGGPASFAEYARGIASMGGEYLLLSRNSETARRMPLLPQLPAHRVHLVLWEKDAALPFHTVERRDLLV